MSPNQAAKAATHSHPVVHPSTHGHLHVPGSSVVHRLTAAPKLVGLFCFVVVMALTPAHRWEALLFDAAIALALLWIGRVPLAAVVSRSWVLAPIIAFAIVIVILGGGEQRSLGIVSVSVTGAWAGFNIAIKALTGVLAAIALTATTSVSDIIEGLSRLHLPKLIVTIIAFMFRYLDLIDDRLTRMRQAMVARCYDPRWLWHAKPIAQSAGAIFVRTYERGERIHMAMLARGYTGEMPRLSEQTTPRVQWFAALVPAALAVIAWLAAG